MNRTLIIATIVLLAVVNAALSQQIAWNQRLPNDFEAQFMSRLTSNSQRFQFPGGEPGLDSMSQFPGMGKLRLLSTLFNGMRNTGLEQTIAGEVLQRFIRTALRDIIVPFKRDIFSSVSGSN